MHINLLAASWGSFTITGHGTMVDLLAASTNALNGALLARRPDHFRGFSIVGIFLMAVIGGIGGGVARDVAVMQVPEAFTNSSYIVLSLAAGFVGYRLAFTEAQEFREGLFQLATNFSLPWYAIVGAQTGVATGLPLVGSLALAVIGPTAGRYVIDVSCDVPPKPFVQSEWFVGTAVLTGASWIALNQLGLQFWLSSLIAFLIGFTFRLLAIVVRWEEPLEPEPKSVEDSAPHAPVPLFAKRVRAFFGLRRVGGRNPQSDHSVGSTPA